VSGGVIPTRIGHAGTLPRTASVLPTSAGGDDLDWDTSPIGAQISPRDQWKQPARCATTGAVTIATGLNAGDSIDGVTLADGDRVLVKDQGGGGVENGIYIVDADPYRALDMDQDAEVLGAAVYVIDGTANGGTAWAVANTAATIVGTDGIAWAALGGGSGMTNPMTTLDDIIVGGAVTGGVAAPARLGKGTDGQVLTVDPTTHHLLWATPGAAVQTTKGDLAGFSTVPARIPVGSDTQVLTADSTQALGLKWAAPGGSAGALVLLEQHTASTSATLDFTACLSSTYDEYQIELLGLVPATNSVAFWMRMGTGGGPTWAAGATYGWAAFVYRAGGSAPTGAEGGATYIQLGYNTDIVNTAAWGVHGTLRLRLPGSSSQYKVVNGVIEYTAGAYRIDNTVRGSYESTTAVTGFRFLFSSGNIASGTIRVYGLAK
jgi:hypothetical protein